MVGDTEADLLFAKQCGFQSIWARYGYGHLERCQQLKPTHTLDEAIHLLDVLGAYTEQGAS